MAKEDKYQSFSQIDYCIRQYYSKYMAPTVAKEKSLIEKNQNKELGAALDKEDNRSLWLKAADEQSGIRAIDRAKAVVDGTGKWNKMSVDDLVNHCTKKWGKDKSLQNDYSTFVLAFYSNLVAQNGGKESKKLAEYAESYVQNRFQSLVVEQLARDKVPHSTASYIAKKTFSDSLLAFVMPQYGLKDGEIGDKVNAKAEAIYNPSAATKAAGFIGATLLDTATTGGLGGAGTATKVALKGAGVAADFGIRTYLGHRSAKNWSNEEYAKAESKAVFGDENAFKKIQEGSGRYRKAGTEFIGEINSVLSRKIKVPPLRSSDTIKKESNALLEAHKGNSAKLVNTIKTDLSKQAISVNANAKVPAWMLNNSAKQNRALAASFYACALEMSVKQQETRKFGGKKMTLQEVSQRAYDYARAAEAIDKKPHSQKTYLSSESQKASDKWDEELARLNAIGNDNKTGKTKGVASYNATSASPASATTGTPPYVQTTAQYAQQQQAQQSSAARGIIPQTAGWGEALEQIGLNGFGDVTKNIGYVLAMLPDMLIGMFTGKNPNMKIEGNLMPLAAIMGGLFVKNPILKMLLLGFGGANLLNNAGHAAIKEATAKSNKAVTYKTYSDEPLNKRITSPVMKGSSMVAYIDGKPVVITISDNAVDAYERGNVPLNTLANAVLRKYDESNSLVASNYAMQNQNEDIEKQRGLK